MSLTKSELEQESGSLFSEQHICEKNELPEHLQVFRVSEVNGVPQEQWEIFSLWLATNEDVMVGEASELGELLNLSSIKIAFCPFCGNSLH